jgi:NADH dehydrogenase
MFLAITGATGYIGTHLTSSALKHGHVVLVASRQKILLSSVTWRPFDLSSPSTLVLPVGIGAIIHLAANTKHANCVEEDCEVAVAQELVNSAQKIGAKFIYVSSQTAQPDAPSAYGRTKWRIEQEVIVAKGWVVRPGQVYGGQLLGLYGMLVNIINSFLLLPAFLPAPKVQPIHVDDLAEGLLRIVERCDVPPGVYSLAATEGISFSKFLDEIAKTRLRRWRGFFPVPVVAIKVLAHFLGEALRVRLALERLDSLFALPIMETAADLNQLGLVLRPLRSGMHPSGNDRRRCLLREGRALLTYVLKEPPSSAVLRRYLRAIELMRGGKALGLPQLFLAYPIYISLIDDSAWVDKTIMDEFSWRMDTATLLAEATPSGAYRFLGLGREHWLLVSFFSVTASVGSEVFWRVLRIILAPIIRLAIGRAKAFP